MESSNRIQLCNSHLSTSCRLLGSTVWPRNPDSMLIQPSVLWKSNSRKAEPGKQYSKNE